MFVGNNHKDQIHASYQKEAQARECLQIMTITHSLVCQGREMGPEKLKVERLLSKNLKPSL